MPRRSAASAEEESLFSTALQAQPLAARMRPRTLDEYVGQRHLLAPGKPLREAVEKGTPGSIIFWRAISWQMPGEMLLVAEKSRHSVCR